MIKARVLKTNIELNNSYENVIHFKNDDEKRDYFERKEPGFFDALEASEDVNFNIGDTLHTSITLPIVEPLNDALNRNYLIVLDYDTLTYTKKYLFYFISNVTPIRDNIIKYDLELDVFTTYNLKDAKDCINYNDYSINQILTNRKHCNRFEGENVISFNFASEEINQPEELEGRFDANIPTNKIPIYFNMFKYGVDKGVINELNNNITSWVLIFAQYIEEPPEGQTRDRQFTKYVPSSDPARKEDGFSQEICIFLAPLTGKINIKKEDGTNTPWDATILQNILKLTTTYKIMAVQVIKNCPIEGGEYFSNEGGILSFDYKKYKEEQSKPIAGFPTDSPMFSYKEFSDYGCLRWDIIKIDQLENKIVKNLVDDPIINPNNFTLDELPALNLKISYEKKELKKEDLKDKRKEIKLLKKPFTKFIIRDISNEGKAYNIFDIKYHKALCKNIEVPQIEGTKEFYGLEGDRKDKPYYYDINRFNLGVVKSNNYSIPIVDDSYADFVRTRKNHFLESIEIPTMSETVSLGQSILSNPLNVIGNINNSINFGKNSLVRLAQYDAHMDDIKNSPDSIRGGYGDFIFSWSTQEGKINNFIETDQLTEKDQSIVFEHFYRFGYKVNEYCNYSDLFTRRIFNYIQTGESALDKIQADKMSNLIKQKIDSALLNGVRFWEAGHFYNEIWEPGLFNDYRFENYENYIFPDDAFLSDLSDKNKEEV